MKFKAMRLLVTGKIRNADQAAQWLAGVGEIVTPDIHEEFRQLEGERDRRKVCSQPSTDYRPYYQERIKHIYRGS
jgi:hypothetical protein